MTSRPRTGLVVVVPGIDVVEGITLDVVDVTTTGAVVVETEVASGCRDRPLRPSQAARDIITRNASQPKTVRRLMGCGACRPRS
jgi:hypothetical protein